MCDMEIKTYVTKFSCLIRRILEEKYDLTRYYKEQLLKHLDDDNDSASKILLGTPVFSDLIFHSIENLRSISIQNKIFILEVLTILFRNELQFNRLQSSGVKLCLLKKYMKDNQETKYPSAELHYAGTVLAASQLSHMSGLKALLSCRSWEYIMCPGSHLKPVFAARAAYKFMAELVWKLDHFEEEAALNEVLDYIMHPIKTSAYTTLTVFDADNEHLISEPIMSSLNVLHTIVTDTERMIKSKILIPIIKVMYCLHPTLHQIWVGSRDLSLLCLHNEITFGLCFTFAAKDMAKSSKTESHLLNEMLVSFHNVLSNLIIKKRMVSAVMDFVVRINIFWAKVGSTLYTSTFERNGKEYLMENQFVIMLIMPLLTYAATSYRFSEDVIERYHVRMGNIVTEHIVKSCYLYKDILDEGDLKSYAIDATKELLKMRSLLKATQAGIVFQSLYYVLEMYLPSEDEDRLINANPLQSTADIKLLSLILDAMKMFLLEHNIHWYENVEIISLQNGLMYLLKDSALPTKQLQQAMDLVELSVKKFLSPDMNLLMESKRGSTLDEIAAVMKSFIQHEEWEIRDSALSLLLSCTDIAFVKYMPLQKLISENELMLLASYAVFNDTEFYVQTTALKCLAAATKIESIWREVLTANRNLYKQLIYLLRNSPEGMIRKEIVNVLTQVYVNQKTTPLFETFMYSIMSTAAIEDLHWEVQKSALCFWKHVMKKHLNNKGMIDGRFPKVTFSKEKRKIIVLNEKEVKKQLSSIMHDLSNIGCLSSLHHCLNDDLSVEVMAHAHWLTKQFLMDVLDFYSFDKVVDDPPRPQPMEEPSSVPPTEEDIDMVLDLSFVLDTEARRDQIISEIVNTKLGDLIMYLNDKYVDHSRGVEENIPLGIPYKAKIHPNKFIEDFKKTDYEKIIQSKRNWMANSPTLNEILDEILEK